MTDNKYAVYTVVSVVVFATVSAADNAYRPLLSCPTASVSRCLRVSRADPNLPQPSTALSVVVHNR